MVRSSAALARDSCCLRRASCCLRRAFFCAAVWDAELRWELGLLAAADEEANAEVEAEEREVGAPGTADLDAGGGVAGKGNHADAGLPIPGCGSSWSLMLEAP